MAACLHIQFANNFDNILKHHEVETNVESLLSITGMKFPGSKEFVRLYKLGHVLGRGGSGTVHSSIRRRAGMKVAVKEVIKDSIIALEDNVLLVVLVMLSSRESPASNRWSWRDKRSLCHLHRRLLLHHLQTDSSVSYR